MLALTALTKALKVELVDLFNYSWLKLSEAELRRKIRAIAEETDLTRLREILALMRARDV
jgi:hypothetical protein